MVEALFTAATFIGGSKFAGNISYLSGNELLFSDHNFYSNLSWFKASLD